MAENMPTYSIEQAMSVINSRFPDLIVEDIYFVGEGSDFCAYAVNDRHLFRFGVNRESIERFSWEQYLLPRLQSKLDISLPQFQVICPMENRRPLCVYPMIKGKSFRREIYRGLSNDSKLRVAKQLADFLTVLHSFPVDAAKACGVRERPMRKSCERFHRDARKVIYPKLSEQEKEVCESWFQKYYQDPANTFYKPALIHGDLQGRHVLFDPESESVAGVIDFSDIWISDPDHDLHYLLREHGEDFIRKLLKWYHHDDPERLFWKSRLFYLLECIDEIVWGLENGHQDPVEEGWRNLREFLTNSS